MGNQVTTLTRYATCLVVVMYAGSARAADAPTPSAAKPISIAGASATKGLSKPLCDETWDYGFYTVVIDRLKYDGKVKIKDFDPQHADEPWSALSDQYLGMKDGGGFVDFLRFIGRFQDEKKAESYLLKGMRGQLFAAHLNPRLPPMVISLGALLVSSQFICKLDKGNPTFRHADWIAEVDGVFYAAKESECKGGQKKKTISVVDCSGGKTLASDTWSAPCDAGRINACLFPMSPGIMGIQQEYSASGEGRQLSFRAYDTAKGRKVFTMKEGYDRTGGPEDFTDVTDVDGDGVPELSDRHCDGDDCQRTRLRKWNGKRFVDVKGK